MAFSFSMNAATVATLDNTSQANDSRMVSPAKRANNLPLGYLRACLTLMVVAHHAALAYYPQKPPAAISLTQDARWWQAFPVVDTVQWKGFLFTVMFNDVYFMSLMFLISGLFVWKSLEHRGTPAFVRGRVLRLGVPFVVAALLGPIAYIPAYLQSSTHDGFWHEWMHLGNWPGGPVWFIWVLLVFDLLMVAVYTAMPGPFLAVSRRLARVKSPLAVAVVLFLLSSLAYVPMALHFNPFEFFIWGPFYVQKARVLLYLAYFLFGAFLGAAGLERGLLQTGGRFAAQWLPWTVAAPACFSLTLALRYLSHRYWAPTPWAIAMDLAFVLSCLASSFAFLAFFLHFVKRERPWLNSLVACAYGIYLAHYFFVSWTQYSLLGIHVPGWAKGAFVFAFATLASWGLVAALRRIPAVARVI